MGLDLMLRTSPPLPNDPYDDTDMLPDTHYWRGTRKAEWLFPEAFLNNGNYTEIESWKVRNRLSIIRNLCSDKRSAPNYPEEYADYKKMVDLCISPTVWVRASY